MFQLQPQQDSDGLQQAAQDAGKLLIEGVRRAPVVTGFYAQVAANMLVADQTLFQGRYRRAIRSGFVGTGVLSVSSAASVDPAAVPAVEPRGLDEELPQVPLTGSAYGLPTDLLVHAAAQPRRISAASGLPDSGSSQPPTADKAADSFVVDLIRRGRIDAPEEIAAEAPISAGSYTTHEIRPVDGAVELRRTRFDCGFGIH
jgi:hypothetical protein